MMLSTTQHLRTRLLAAASRGMATAAQQRQQGKAGLTKVMKFGGSSVGSSDAFRRVAAHLSSERAAGHSVVGVLSAMFGVTNHLISAANSARQGDMQGVKRSRDALFGLHHSTTQELVSSSERRDSVLGWMDQCLSVNFDQVCNRIADSRQCSTFDMDVISSLGERLSNKLMSEYFVDAGLSHSECIQADELIITDGVSGSATPDLQATRERVDQRLAPLLQAGAVPLVTGFFGASRDGKLTTLGRGGSDLTAAVLGHCLDADEVALFKVESTTGQDGWMATWEDGWVGVVHDADVTRTIPELAYEEAAELAHFGKKVLHPATVGPAVVKDIPIRVCSTYNPQHPGTTIRRMQAAEGAPRVHAVTKISLPEYEAKSKNQLDLSDALAGARDLRKEEAAIVAMVGSGVAKVADAEGVVKYLAAHGVKAAVPRRVNGSEHNFSVVVPEEMKKRAVALLHKQFVDGPGFQARA